MGIFGWSYPAGCSGPPDDDDGPCLTCGKAVDDCICPECLECGETGREACYAPRSLSGCGMIATADQTAGVDALKAAWEEQRRREDAWAAAEVEAAKLPECTLCGHRFDRDTLGRYGCPNCNGEGLE